jgi:hypothetical protein
VRLNGNVDYLGWSLQFLALIIVGSALLIGLVYGSMSGELTLLAVGGAVFLIGRWLQQRES